MSDKLRDHDYGGVGHSVSLKGGLEPNSANYSEYYKSILGARDGGVVNYCPFGCPDDELDEHGRCYHRVGVSPDGKFIEPEIRKPNGQTWVQVPRKKVNGKMRPDLPRVDKRKHTLVRVTTSYIVYEDRDCPEGWVPAGEADDEPETEEGD